MRWKYVNFICHSHIIWHLIINGWSHIPWAGYGFTNWCPRDSSGLGSPGLWVGWRWWTGCDCVSLHLSLLAFCLTLLPWLVTTTPAPSEHVLTMAVFSGPPLALRTPWPLGTPGWLEVGHLGVWYTGEMVGNTTSPSICTNAFPPSSIVYSPLKFGSSAANCKKISSGRERPIREATAVMVIK